MTRNCWTCLHDSIEEESGAHICHAAWCGGAVTVWIEEHVSPDRPGVPPSMPPMCAPPCPGWVAEHEAGAEATAAESTAAETAATDKDSLTVGGGER